MACRRRYPAFGGKTKDSVRYEVFRRDRFAMSNNYKVGYGKPPKKTRWKKGGRIHAEDGIQSRSKKPRIPRPRRFSGGTTPSFVILFLLQNPDPVPLRRRRLVQVVAAAIDIQS